MSTWNDHIHWTTPVSVDQLIHGDGGRTVIPTDRGFYCFVAGNQKPAPERCLYLGVAAGKTGIRQRLRSYLRASVTEGKAAAMKHRGKRLLSYARIKGLQGAGAATRNTTGNDQFIHVSWAIAPLNFASASGGLHEREYIYLLERALIANLRPLYNTADWGGHLELELDEDYGA